MREEFMFAEGTKGVGICLSLRISIVEILEIEIPEYWDLEFDERVRLSSERTSAAVSGSSSALITA